MDCQELSREVSNLDRNGRVTSSQLESNQKPIKKTKKKDEIVILEKREKQLLYLTTHAQKTKIQRK